MVTVSYSQGATFVNTSRKAVLGVYSHFSGSFFILFTYACITADLLASRDAPKKDRAKAELESSLAALVIMKQMLFAYSKAPVTYARQLRSLVSFILNARSAYGLQYL